MIRISLKSWFIILAFSGALLFFGYPLKENLSCPKEQKIGWNIDGYIKPGPKKHEPQKTELFAIQKNSSGDAQDFSDKYFCKDFRLTDWALVTFTYMLAIVGWFTLKSADDNTKRKERAYIACAGLWGIPNDAVQNQWLNEWLYRHRAQASMFHGPWRMAIHNRGQTAGFTTKVEWGMCPDQEYPRNCHGKYVRVSKILNNRRYAGFRRQFMMGFTEIQDILVPQDEVLHYRHCQVTDEERKPGHIFFGRIKYKDVFGDPHYSTFALRITDNGNHTDGVADAYSDDHD